MAEQEAEGDIEAELVSTIRDLKALLQKINSVEEGLEDEFPIPPEDADGREELCQKRKEAIGEVREQVEAQREETRALLHNFQKQLHRYRETGSILTEKAKEQAEKQAEKLAREIFEELREFCPPVLEDWDEHTHEGKKRIVAEKLAKVERHLAFEEDPKMETYRQVLKSEWEHLQRLEGLESETSFDPVDAAEKVFEELTRSKDDGTKIPEKVRQWAVKSHEFFVQERAFGSEKAKTEVVNLAEKHGFEFSRPWLVKQIGR